MTTEQAAWYLAALIDGEGCIHFNESTGASCVQVTNSDTSILDAAEKVMDVLGLPRSKRTLIHDERDHRQQCWSIRVLGGRESYEKVFKLVPLQCARKREKLAALVASYPEPRPKPTTEWLREEYVVRRRIASDIGREIGWSGRMVYHWLESAGVQRRSKREAALLCKRGS